jgi:hypothetical protein
MHNNLQMNSDFIDNFPTVAASATQSMAKPLPSIEDTKRLMDSIVSATVDPEMYNKVNVMYKMAQMHGKNCSAESLLASFAECCKQNANVDDKVAVDKLCKNIANTFECISLMQKVDQQMLIAFVLGYAYSIISEKSS